MNKSCGIITCVYLNIVFIKYIYEDIIQIIHLFINNNDNRCLMVGLPCGQFHGFCICAICIISLCISLVFRAVPIITALRHALDASICLTRLGRYICFSLFSLPASLMRNTNSSISSWPNCQWPLTGIPINSIFLPGSAKTVILQ